MGIIAIENRIKRLNELEAQIDALKAESDRIRSEIKDAMEKQGVEEIHTKNFTVRWKLVFSERFDSKAFKTAHPDLFKEFSRLSMAHRFTIN